MKCPSCLAVIDDSYVESFGSAQSVSCPACGFMLATGAHDLFSTATEFKAISGWTIRLAKGQEVHFESEAAFGTWLKETTVTPGDMICKDGTNWQSLGSYLLGQRNPVVRDSGAYKVPPTTLDAPDPEDEFEELDNAFESLDVRSETSRPDEVTPITLPTAPIMSTSIGHEKRVPPPIPARSTSAQQAVDVAEVEALDSDETVTIAAITTEELSTASNLARVTKPEVEAPTPPRTVSPAGERQSAIKAPRVAGGGQSVQAAKGNGGFGKLLIGLVIGAVAASFAGLDLKSTDTKQSSAQRVVVTKQIPEMSLQDKERLETSERWLSYSALSSITAVQLRSRLEASKETTARGRAHRNALVLAAYVLDVHRTKGAADNKGVLDQYNTFMMGADAGPLANAFKSLQSLTLQGSSNGEKKADATMADVTTVAKAETENKPAQPNPTLNAPLPTAADSRAAPTTKPNEKGVEAKPAASKKTSARTTTSERSKPSSKKDKATYSKMLRAGTRHLENGRLKDASIALKKAADIKPKAHAPQFKLGYVALNRGNLAQALRYFKRARDLKPRDRETLLGLGSVYEKMGRRADARKVYERYQTYFKGANDRRRIEYKLEKLDR